MSGIKLNPLLIECKKNVKKWNGLNVKYRMKKRCKTER